MHNKKYCLALLLLLFPVFGFECSEKTKTGFSFDIVKEKFDTDFFGKDFLLLELKLYNGRKESVTSVDFSLKTCEGVEILPRSFPLGGISCVGGFVPMHFPCTIAFDLPNDLPEDCSLTLYAQPYYGFDGFGRQRRH